MQIFNNNLNFKGGFRFPSMPIEAKNQLPGLAKKGKQIFYDFEKQGDVFLVTRDELNYKVLNLIKQHDLKFEFYPKINTKMGLDSEEHGLLSFIVKNCIDKPITTKTQLMKRIANNCLEKKVEEESPKYVSQILKGLQMDANSNIEIVKGVNVINYSELQKKVHISRPIEDNKHLVLIEPYSSNQPSERLLVDSNGLILKKFNKPYEISCFYSEFRKTILK